MARRTGHRLAAMLLFFHLSATASSLQVRHLRCEYALNPLGVGETQPRLSWVLHSEARAQRQTAWQILVGRQERAVRRGQADLWDSGRVESDATAQIVYAGQPLASRQRCFWKVRVWDQDGAMAESEIAWWEMGLLQPSDWEARWIGLEQPWPGERTWLRARWIWARGLQPIATDPDSVPTNLPPKACFRRTVNLPEDRTLQRALLRLTADDYFDLFINGHEVGHNAGKPYSCKILQEFELREWLRPGTNLIAVLATNREAFAGLLGQLVLEFDHGAALALETDRSWLTHPLGPPGWSYVGGADLTGSSSPAVFPETNWTPALELAKPG